MNHCIRELDFLTNTVQSFIGRCSIGEYNNRPHVFLTTSQQNVSVTEHFLKHPVEAVYLHSRSLLLVGDVALDHLLKVDLYTKTASLLCSQCNTVNSQQFQSLRDLISDTEEKYIYVSHKFGLSRLDIDTYDVTLLVGGEGYEKAQLRGFSKPPPFDRLQSGSMLHTLHWLIPDQLLVSSLGFRFGPVTSVVVVDLVNSHITYLCNSKSLYKDMSIRCWLIH